MDNLKQTIKKRMMRILRENSQEFLFHGEVNLTMLAEITAQDMNHDEWLDDSDHIVWDCAVEVSKTFERENFENQTYSRRN